MSAEQPGKRVSWVELYLDLIMALAVGQLAHVIVADPDMGSVWIAFGLFVTMWWTWIGFAVLYNRDGDDQSAGRLLFLAGSVPTGVAAVAIEPASLGHITAFAVAMAVTRVLLAGARVMHDGWAAAARMAIVRAYVLSAALFTASIALTGPGRFVLWGFAIAAESSALLTEDRTAARKLRHDGNLGELRPRVAGEALDAHHFAERFGLLIGTKIFLVAASLAGRIACIAVVVATIELGWLADVLSPHAFLWLIAAWTAGLAALATRFTRDVDDERLSDYAP